MKEDDDLSISALRNKRGESPTFYNSKADDQDTRGKLPPSPTQVNVESAPGKKGSLLFDSRRLVGGLILRWYWMLLPGVFLAGIGVVVALLTIPYKAKIQLLRQPLPTLSASGNSADSLKPRELNSATLLGLLRSVELLRNISESKTHRIDPPVTFEELDKGAVILPERNSDIVTVEIGVQGSRQRVVEVANLYLAEVHKFFSQFASQEIGLIKATFQNSLRQIEVDMSRAQENLRLFLETNQSVDLDKQIDQYLGRRGQFDERLKSAEIELEALNARIQFLRQEMDRQRPENERLNAAHQELAVLLTKYTEAHPAVLSQRAKLASLEHEVVSASTRGDDRPPTDQNSMAQSLYRQILDLEGQRVALNNQTVRLTNEVLVLQTNLARLSENSQKFASYKARVQENQIALSLLENRQREVELQESRLARLSTTDSGYFRLLGEARLTEVDRIGRWKKVAVVGLAGLWVGMIFGGGIVLLSEAFDPRLKTAGDVERVTQLPVLASLGDLREMDEETKAQWSFRAWTMISGRLSYSPNRGLVCGIISAQHGEGRSTWIDLLVDAANQRGLKVLTVTTRPPSRPGAEFSAPVADIEPAKGSSTKTPVSGEALLTTALVAPSQVTEKLTGPNALPVVHIPLPGWVWNLERRAQWQASLAHWRSIDNLALLVELPPASVSEAVLLAENLPQVIWLTGSGLAEAGETRHYLNILRHARCNIVGAVLNFEPTYPLIDPFRHRFGGA
jgi:hypothetical protein